MSHFESPEIAMPLEATWLRDPQHRRVIDRDIVTNLTKLKHIRDEGAFRINSHGMIVDSQGIEEHSIVSTDPLSAHGLVNWQLRLARDTWHTLVECSVEQTTTEKTFELDVTLLIKDNDSVICSKKPRHSINRVLV